MGRGLAGFFSFLGLGTATTGVGLVGALWPSPIGGRPQTHAIASTDATIQINPDTLQGTVYVNGVATTISVVATTVDINGNPTGFTPAPPVDAASLSTLGVDISDPSGIVDTSPLNSEGVDETEEVGATPGMDDGLPVRDSSGKVHGVLPTQEQLRGYPTEELEDFQDELQGSVEEMISKNEELGPDKAHGERQAAEQIA